MQNLFITVNLRFNIVYNTTWGQSILILGSTKWLGNWDINNCKPLKYERDDIWSIEIVANVKKNEHLQFEYKYILFEEQTGLRVFESGDNHCFDSIISCENNILINDTWNNEINTTPVAPISETPKSDSDLKSMESHSIHSTLTSLTALSVPMANSSQEVPISQNKETVKLSKQENEEELQPKTTNTTYSLRSPSFLVIPPYNDKNNQIVSTQSTPVREIKYKEDYVIVSKVKNDEFEIIGPQVVSESTSGLGIAPKVQGKTNNIHTVEDYYEGNPQKVTKIGLQACEREGYEMVHNQKNKDTPNCMIQ